MASIRERPRKDGSTTWAVLWRDADTGTQTSRTFADEREARTLKDFLDANGNSFALAAKAATRMRSQAPSVATVVTEHVETLTGVLTGTRQKYERIAERHIVPQLGAYPVDTLSRADVSRWLNGLELSAKSKRNVHSILSAALSEAVDRKLIPGNPAKGIKMPTGETRREPVFLTPEQVEAIAEAIDPHYRTLITFLAGTGLRWSEATALNVHDLDLVGPHGMVSVTKAWKHSDRTMTLGAPKTKRGKRTIALSRNLTQTMREHVAAMATDALVFARPDGTVLRNDVFHKYTWAPALRACAEVLPVAPRIHDLRHTHASWLIQNAVALTVIQRRLGHESIKTTSDVYGHLADDADRLAADVLDR